VDFYEFAVTNFRINHTRAIHEDSLYLTHTVYADGDVIAANPSPVSLGDFNNGDYNPQDFTSPGPGLSGIVINDRQATVSFVFQLLNAGNVEPDALDGRTASSADQLAGIAAGLQGAAAVTLGTGAIPVSVALEVFANVWTWLTTDCDGPVAADQLSGPRYLIDAWADDDPTGSITMTRKYPGSQSPDGCGDNSDYDVTWFVQHYRGWAEVVDTTQSPLKSGTGVSAATHNGAVHAFGVLPGTGVTHSRTYTGVNWFVDSVGTSGLGDLPVSAVSFNDRLYVFGVKTDGSISPAAYTVDGGSWRTPPGNSPVGLQTAEPIATAVFRSRLYVFGRDSSSNSLRLASTADLLAWSPWADVPMAGLSPTSPVAAAALGDRLYIFGINQTGKPPEIGAVVSNSTLDGTTWTGWTEVEAGLRPAGMPSADEALDVAASVDQGRLYIAARWQSATTTAGQNSYYVAVNFTSDGDNWSGWRIPDSTVQFQPAATAGLVAVGNHLYILAPQLIPGETDNVLVSSY
jgi:hypothetical protein